jgi:hypothetical protein
MLLSVPDTPFGRALGQFMLQFDRPGLDVVQAHGAFAELSALAASEHPQMVWPLAIPREDGPPFLVTVEGMLADKRARYNHLQPIDPATVAAALVRWTDATVRSAQIGPAPQERPHLHIELKTPTGQTQWLTAHCPWQVVPAHTSPHQWNDEALSLKKAAVKLRRARVQHIEVQPTGTLRVTFANGTQLVVGSPGWEPNAEVADLHYFLQMEDQIMLRVGDQFLMEPLEMGEPPIPVSIL